LEAIHATNFYNLVDVFIDQRIFFPQIEERSGSNPSGIPPGKKGHGYLSIDKDLKKGLQMSQEKQFF
jgi:hypothetical protein